MEIPISKYRDTELPRYEDNEIRIQARSARYRGTEIRKDSYLHTKIPKECPRSLQDGPKTGQDGTKYGQDGSKTIQDNPNMAQDSF